MEKEEKKKNKKVSLDAEALNEINAEDMSEANNHPEEKVKKENNFQEEINKLKDQLLRAMAETENVKKRMSKQIEDANNYSITNFAKDLIVVMDNLDRALESLTTAQDDNNTITKNMSEGILITKKELEKAFAKYHIKMLQPQVGDIFDHNLHQAVAQIPSDEHEEGSIVSIMQNGYSIKDRLLRPAMVSVAKKQQ